MARADELHRTADVLQRAGPSSAFFTGATVLNIRRYVPRTGQGGAWMSGVREVDSCAPESAVNVDGEDSAPLARGVANIHKLTGVLAVGNPLVRRRRRLIHHAAAQTRYSSARQFFTACLISLGLRLSAAARAAKAGNSASDENRSATICLTPIRASSSLPVSTKWRKLSSARSAGS